MREAAESHHGLFPEHAHAYGANVRAKVERCLAVGDAEFEGGRRRVAEYRERAAEAIEGIELLITPDHRDGALCRLSRMGYVDLPPWAYRV